MMKRLIPLCLLCLVMCGSACAQSRLDRLTVLGDEWPRVFFFRMAEGRAIQLRDQYGKWNAEFDRLMGIEGKSLNEEVPGRAGTRAFFTRFKQDHPDQLVMLHFNGNARDPRDAPGYFAGHWLYCNGATIGADVPAESGQTAIKVDDTRLFVVNGGRYKRSNDDIGLCELDAAGRLDWSRSEQVQLVSVDHQRKVIVVNRGCYGTTPRSFKADRAYAAAHVGEGPWGKDSNLLWQYNHSLRCPRDADGRVCDDLLVSELAAHLNSGGDLATYDGLEFDVLRHTIPPHASDRRSIDTDADGQIDDGYIDGVNEYGRGVVEFLSALRRKLGDERLILADGQEAGNQRGFGILNGIESEGWPDLRDHDIDDWSGGLNRHFYWAAHARAPAFSYFNHKFTERGDQPGDTKEPDTPWRIHRLVFAAAMFTDSAICASFTPPPERGEIYGIWDEFRKGTEHQLGWLGKPLGPPMRLATTQADALAGVDLTNRLTAEGATIRVERDGVTLTPIASDKGDAAITLIVHDVPCDGPDLFITMTAAGASLPGDPPTVARLMFATAEQQKYQSWLGSEPFESTFYFKQLPGKTVDIVFSFEGRAAVTITRLSAYAAPDTIARAYEHGLVIANPAPHPVTIDLAKLRPDEHYRRLRGSPMQDTQTNDGSAVTGPLVLQGKDALFLVRDE
ncbi:MAG: hypothetical protein GC162_20485 [Planctomycetes bacterium]|nr:hypothetical protein [Planctomycetota bacterium]